MNTWTQPARAAFSTNPGIRAGLCVHLHHEVDVEALGVAESRESVEEALPLGVAREIVVGEEVVPDVAPSREPVVSPHLFEDLIGAARAHLPPLDVDDGAEGAGEGAAAAGVDGPVVRHDEPPLRARGGVRERDVGEVGRRAEEVVERPQPVRDRVLEDAAPAALHLAEHQRDARVEHGLALGRCRGGHRHRAADVEAADEDGESFALELECEVPGPGPLVRLNADQPYHGHRTGPPEAPAEPHRIHARDDFVDRFDLDLGRAERARTHRLFGQAVEAAQGVAGQGAAPMPDDVAVIVVPRRSNQQDNEPPGGITHNWTVRCLRRGVCPIGHIAGRVPNWPVYIGANVVCVCDWGQTRQGLACDHGGGFHDRTACGAWTNISETREAAR